MGQWGLEVSAGRWAEMGMTRDRWHFLNTMTRVIHPKAVLQANLALKRKDKRSRVWSKTSHFHKTARPGWGKLERNRGAVMALKAPAAAQACLYVLLSIKIQLLC